jgi:hypothetical protein
MGAMHLLIYKTRTKQKRAFIPKENMKAKESKITLAFSVKIPSDICTG